MDAIGIDVACLWGGRRCSALKTHTGRNGAFLTARPYSFLRLQYRSGAQRGHSAVSGRGQDTGSEREDAEGGYYVDAIVRQQPIDDATLSVGDNLEEFTPIAVEDLEHFRKEQRGFTQRQTKPCSLRSEGRRFGDIALVPAMWLRIRGGSGTSRSGT